jgi:hypothetical protein
VESEVVLVRTQARLEAIEHTVERLRGVHVSASADQTALTPSPDGATPRRLERNTRRTERK